MCDGCFSFHLFCALSDSESSTERNETDDKTEISEREESDNGGRSSKSARSKSENHDSDNPGEALFNPLNIVAPMLRGLNSASNTKLKSVLSFHYFGKLRQSRQSPNDHYSEPRLKITPHLVLLNNQCPLDTKVALSALFQLTLQDNVIISHLYKLVDL